MAKFKGRLYLIGIEDGVQRLEVFSEELDPMVEGKRPVSEWAAESISEVSVADLYSDLQLDPTKCFQVVFEGEIIGHNHGLEYDEELYLNPLSSAEIPAKYLEAITDPLYDTIQPEDILTTVNGCLRVNNTPFVVLEPDQPLTGVDEEGKLKTSFRGLTNVWDHSDIKGYYA